jgi:PAS domain S-box-containing protein
MYHELLTSAVEGICRIDENGRFTYCNEAAARALGYSGSDSPIGKSFHKVHHRSPDGTICPAEECRLCQGMLRGESYVRNALLFRLDGSNFPAEYRSSPIDHDHNQDACTITFLDVTQRISTEQQLRRAQKFEGVSRLAAGAAHDLNNVLMAVSGYSDLILHSAPQNAAVVHYAEQIAQSAQRAAAVVNQLLGISRNNESEPNALNIDSVVSDFSKILPSFFGSKVDVVTRLDTPLKQVSLDRGQMEQIIINLAINARDAMPRGGRFCIETQSLELDQISAQLYGSISAGAYVVLTVSDNGIGMDPETKSHIFQQFFTTKPRGKGTGLGLSTVREIVEQRGGFLTVDSEQGQGTKFTLFFPSTNASSGLAPSSFRIGQGQGASNGIPPLHKHVAGVPARPAAVA